MGSLVDNLLRLGPQRLVIMAIAFVGVLMAVLLGLRAVSAPDFIALYRNLSPAAVGSVEATLSRAGFPVQVSEDGSSILVPRGDLARARMMVAESGVPIDGEPGWELFDEQSGLTMNSFMQKINRLRAMEGELARSIATLDGVQNARVHLVLPEREPFSREAPTSRASVVIRAVPGRTISQKQAVAVRNMVASAVPELDVGRVTVLSASGELILAENGQDAGPATMQSNKSAIESRMAQEIRNILTARVGAGNARVRVNVELTSQREVIVEQSYNPDQQVVRSTESSTESQSGTENDGNVGVENNIPAALTDEGAGGGATSSRNESGETVTYEIGNTRREVVREAGEVKRVSVAVLVNGIFNVEGSEVVYAERTPEELARLEDLVQTAVGFDERRGDTISVDSMRFMDYSMEVGEPVSPSIGDQLSQNVVSIVRSLLALIIVGLVLVLGVRPLLRQLADAPPAAPTPEELPAPETADADALATTPGGALPPPPADQVASLPVAQPAELADPADIEPQYIETDGVRGDLLKARVEQTQKLATEKPDDVLRVLRTWLLTEADA